MGNSTEDKMKNLVRQVLDIEDFYYKETRYPDGTIKIESKNKGLHISIFGGKGFTEEYDKAFNEAIKDSIKDLKDIHFDIENSVWQDKYKDVEKSGICGVNVRHVPKFNITHG